MIHFCMARPLLYASLALALSMGSMSPTPSHAQSKEITASETEKPVIDDRAMDKLRAMSDVLEAAKSMKIHAIAFFDEVEESGVKNKRIIEHSISLKRPDRLRFTSTFDDGEVREGYFNGKHLIMANPSTKKFVRLEIEGNIDTLLDTLNDKYQMNIPITDLLYSSVLSAQQPYILSGVYLGERTLVDLEMDHLSFESVGTEWQVWLRKSSHLPVRMLIRFVEHKSEPEYMVTFLDWKINTVTAEDLTFIISPDWELVANVMGK